MKARSNAVETERTWDQRKTIFVISIYREYEFILIRLWQKAYLDVDWLYDDQSTVSRWFREQFYSWSWKCSYPTNNNSKIYLRS